VGRKENAPEVRCTMEKTGLNAVVALPEILFAANFSIFGQHISITLSLNSK
jgi:hypothetical protein